MMKKSHALFYCIILGFIIQGASCSILSESFRDMGNPRAANYFSETGTKYEKAKEDITPEEEYYIGRTVGAIILTNYSVYWGNSDFTQYINQICKAIAINSPQPELFNGYHAAILDSQEINAFATSGGHIFITRGLLDCAESEDTLAAVIAHEVAHIQLQHSIKAIKSSRFAEFGVSLAAPLSELVSVFDESVHEIVDTLVINGYSQEQEFDADALALELLASAGYEPSSLNTMLHSLEKNQSAHPGGFNKTHPAPEDRIKNVQKLLKNYKVRDTRSYRTPRYIPAAR
jgi:predicted Zn-dependent protease